MWERGGPRSSDRDAFALEEALRGRREAGGEGADGVEHGLGLGSGLVERDEEDEGAVGSACGVNRVEERGEVVPVLLFEARERALGVS